MFPGICVVFIYTFSGSWGNFFIPYILLSSKTKLPAAVMLYQFFGQHGTIAYGPLAAYSIIYALPSVLLYVLSQNYMSKGFTMAGAAKGWCRCYIKIISKVPSHYRTQRVHGLYIMYGLCARHPKMAFFFGEDMVLWDKYSCFDFSESIGWKATAKWVLQGGSKNDIDKRKNR